MKLTRKEAIENHRKMWKWIAEKSLERKEKVHKEAYFEENDRIDWRSVPDLHCYCCHFTKQNNEDRRLVCNACPLMWGDNVADTCIDIYRNGVFFEYKGIWSKWTNEHDYVKAAEYALQIANLPERRIEDENN